jgi:hypothetical protein
MISKLFVLLFWLVPAFAAPDPDIIVLGKLDKSWSQRFLDHLRAVMVRNVLPDPYARTLDKPVVFELGDSLLGVSGPGQEWLRSFQELFRVDMAQSRFAVVLDRLDYKIEKFDAAVLPRPLPAGVEWLTSHGVEGLELGAGRMSLQVTLATRGAPVTFEVGLVNPRIVLRDMVVPLTTVWRSSVDASALNVELEQVDLRQTLQTMREHPEKVEVRIEDIIVPDVAFRVGNRTVRLAPERLRQLVFGRQEEFKRLLLDLMATRNQEVLADITGDEVLAFPLSRDYYIAGEKLVLSSAATLDSLDAPDGFVRATMSGVLCVPKDATDLASCRQLAPRNPRPVRAGRDLVASERTLREEIIQRRADILVSVSEPFVNQALAAAIKAGLMDEAFEEAGDVELAPGGALARLDRAGDVFEGYLHVKNRLTGWDRRLTGRSEVRFPVLISVKIRLDNLNGVPAVVVEVVDAQASRNLLLRGLSSEGMPSTVARVPRFRDKVIDKIQASLRKFKGTRIVEMPLPFLQGTFLTRTELVGDGHGRAQARVRVDDKVSIP